MENKKYTELLWNGKYQKSWFDEFFKIKENAQISNEKQVLAFQTVETINEPRFRGAVQKAISKESKWPENYPKDWKNMLIWGDNKVVMGSLLSKFINRINLIYIDPPFFTGADFSVKTKIGDEEIFKEPSIIEQRAYTDTWHSGMASYLSYMYGRLLLMKELLAPDGSIYIHLGEHVVHYVKSVLDEIFTYDNWQGSIIWNYRTYSQAAVKGSRFENTHDVILHYVKNDKYTFNPYLVQIKIPISEARENGFQKDNGGWFKTAPTGQGIGGYSDEAIKKMDKEGLIYWTKNKMPRKKYYCKEKDGFILEEKMIGDVWSDIPDMMHASKNEILGYETQKPEELIKRIILSSSKEGDIVADFFCGSGTTGAVAEKLGRRWIMSDLSKYAIQVSRKRLLNINNSNNLVYEDELYGDLARPFEILNIGNYELEYFNERPENYLDFILKLYNAEKIKGFNYLHGKKGSRVVHIGPLNAPVSMDEVKEVLKECIKNNITKLDILGWEWAYEINELAKEQAEKQGIDLKLIQIPSINEIKSALVGFDLRLLKIPEQIVDKALLENIHFNEVSYLEIEKKIEDKIVSMKITDFQITQQEMLDEIKDSIKGYSDLIDYWAIDWEYEGDTFHNQWQSYRTKKEPKLATEAKHTYANKGKHLVMIKVVDIFGNDTNKVLEVVTK